MVKLGPPRRNSRARRLAAIDASDDFLQRAELNAEIESLAALIDQCRDLGALVFDPHQITVEEGGLGHIDPAQVAAKTNHDPAGLLNPGKLRGWLEAKGASGWPPAPRR